MVAPYIEHPLNGRTSHGPGYQNAEAAQELREHINDLIDKAPEWAQEILTQLKRDERALLKNDPTMDVTFVGKDGGEPCTDLGNSERFIRYCKEHARYTPDFGWMVWDRRRWLRDEKEIRVRYYAKLTVRAIAGEADSAKTNDVRYKELTNHARKSESDKAIRAMIHLAEGDPSIAAKAVDFDSDPWLLNVLNGVIDLRSGKLLPHNPARLITKLAPVEYDPDAKAPIWKAFLRRIFDGDQELISFMQRYAGLSLTGIPSEDWMLAYGQGANGKSTWKNAFCEVLGEYATHPQASTFMVTRSSSNDIRPDLVKLKGARFIASAESENGQKLAEGLIKQITGRDHITARNPHGLPITFMPEGKLLICTNHKPTIKGTDHGTWRRVMLVPFMVTIPKDEQDPTLADKLRSEASGILNWAMEGCSLWQKMRLAPPKAVLNATQSYQTEMDDLGDFIRQCCEVDKAIATKTDDEKKRSTYKTPYKDLYEAFLNFNDSNFTKRDFAKGLTERGFLKAPGTGNVITWFGIRSLDQPQQAHMGES